MEQIIKDLISLMTLLGMAATAFLAWWAKHRSERNGQDMQHVKDLLAENTVVTKDVKDAVNGQRHALELRITALEQRLELATLAAKEQAIRTAEIAIQTAKDVAAQTAAALAERGMMLGLNLSLAPPSPPAPEQRPGDATHG